MKDLSLETREYLLQLLNAANTQIRQTRETPHAKELLQGRSFVPLAEAMPTLYHTQKTDETSDQELLSRC